MTVQELRKKYLEFFVSKGHSVHASGSLIPYDVTGSLDESLLFNGAGMVQFKPYFRGIAQPPSKRLVNSQKCIRTGDIDEVGDFSHLTFFEMLGNFSFGDYFKQEAIAYSWEFLTDPNWLGLDPSRLAFTVFAEDQESYDYWAGHLRSVGIDPETRLFRLGEETNYWPAGAFTSGPPGPCGPNSEMFYWTVGEPPRGTYTAEDYVRDADAGYWLEIWNDVFIQSEWQGNLVDPSRPDKGYVKTGMPNLPFQSVDTGMGIERTVAVLNGFSSVYLTDAFGEIMSMLTSLAGPIYGDSDGDVDRAMRIIADHIRSATFCIADGILPSNTGRGYVLRRLIRRAVLKGSRVLGLGEPFLHLLAQSVILLYGTAYRELADRSQLITQTLLNEEQQFLRTLDSGSQILEKLLHEIKASKGNCLSGADAFQLYDTFGFPLEVTRELSNEQGISLDEEGFLQAMTEAQERSRQSGKMTTVYGKVILLQTEKSGSRTEFTGYQSTSDECRIVGTHPLVEDDQVLDEFVLALDRSPFYAESGGQVADTGYLVGSGFRLKVKDVTKQGDLFVHLVEDEASQPGWLEGQESNAAEILQDKYFNQLVQAQVDEQRRLAITRNHTATHLLHAALRKTVGNTVTQAGSLVSEDILRFDFTHTKGLTQTEIDQVESIVNQMVLSALPIVTYEGVPIDKARDMGAMALFGEKYADFVRVVQVGDMAPSQSSFSRELCGGIHVANTSQIGLFKIVHEGSVASGIRRITALTGEKSYQWVNERLAIIADSAARLKAQPDNLPDAIERLQDQLKEERKTREKLMLKVSQQSVEAKVIGQFEYVCQEVSGISSGDIKTMLESMSQKANAVLLVVNQMDDRLNFTCKVMPDARSAGANAGEIVKILGNATGGGGGGKPEFASAGGRDPSKLADALQEVESYLAQLG